MEPAMRHQRSRTAAKRRFFMHRPVTGMAAVGFVASLFIAAPAFAWTGEVAWPTYFRTGPGDRYSYQDEIPSGRSVEVQSCERDWCRIVYDDHVGYVKQEILSPKGALAAAKKPAAPPQGEAAVCFEATRDGYDKGDRWRYCAR